jgi:hypothetical protein
MTPPLPRVGPSSSTEGHFLILQDPRGPYSSTRTWTGLPKCCMHSTLGDTKFYLGGLSSQFSPLAFAAVFLQPTTTQLLFIFGDTPLLMIICPASYAFSAAKGPPD